MRQLTKSFNTKETIPHFNLIFDVSGDVIDYDTFLFDTNKKKIWDLFPIMYFKGSPEEVLVENIEGYEIEIYEKQYYLDLSLEKFGEDFFKLKVLDRTNYYSNIQVEQSAKNKMYMVNSDLLQEMSLLRRKNENLKSHVYHLSHDLRHPVDIIKGYLNILEEELDINSSSLEMIRELKKQSELLSNMISSSLDLQKISTTSIINLTSLNIEEILGELEANLDFKKPYVINKVIDKFCTLKVNKTLFYELFYNLMSNSIKYNDKESVIIDIKSWHVDEGFCIEYKDNGIGIKQENLDLIFELFYTTDYTQENRSFGVGLATVKRIVDLYHGSIKVQSNIGNGVVFHMKFSGL